MGMKTVRELLAGRAQQTTTVGPDATVFSALETLASGNFGALPVVAQGRVVGIVSERDYARKVILAGRSSRDTRVAEIMTPNPVCLTADQSIDEAMRLMTDGGFRHLPVMDGGSLVGMVSMKDLVREVMAAKDQIIDYALYAGKQKDDYLQLLKKVTFEKMLMMSKSYLLPLKGTLEQICASSSDDVRSSVRQISKSLDGMVDAFDHVSRWYFAEQAMDSRRVLLAETDRKAQVVARMALGGTGVELDIVETHEAGRARLESVPYDIVCVDSNLLDLAALARQRNADAQTVFFTTEDIPVYLPILRSHPHVSNIVSRLADDRMMLVKSIVTTVSKLITRDIFGIEKYVNWGTDVQEAPVVASSGRRALLDRMETHLRSLGVRASVVRKCVTAAEEMLLNAIYDAPRDETGKQLFDRDRSAHIQLAPEQRSVFRWACDGLMIAISVQDPFGAIERDTILDYLEGCYGNRDMQASPSGGAGRGIFMIMESADLTIFNVKKGHKSEVIALFAVDLETRKKMTSASFHCFTV